MKTILKVVWVFMLYAYTLTAEELPKEDLERVSKSIHMKSYETLNKEEQEKIKSTLHKQAAVFKLATNSDIVSTEPYKKAVEDAKKMILMNMYLKGKRDAIVVKPLEIEAYYKKHIEDYTSVHAFTLVRKKPEKIEAYIKILNDTPKDKLQEKFTALAKEHSQHLRKSQGGDMGFINYNSIVQPFGEEAFKLKENTITQKPVKTVLGFHLIYVKERKVIPFEKAKKNIEKYLRSQKYKTWFNLIGSE